MSAGSWDAVTLSDVATFSSGKTPSRSRQAEFFDRGTVPWVKTLDLTNTGIDATDERVTTRAIREVKLVVHPAGTVLVAMYGGFNQIGRTGVLRIPAATNQAITAVLPDRARLHPDFLLHTLNYRVGYWRTVASSSRKDPNITKADVRAFPLALPPVAEQERVAAALTHADELADSLARLIAKKQAIKQGIAQQLLPGRARLPGFTEPWETHRLSELLAYEHPTPYLVSSTDYAGSGTPVLTAGKTFVLGHTSEQHGIYRSTPVIIFDDFTTDSKLVTFPFKAKSSAMKILSAKPGVNLRWAYERMQLITFQAADHKRRWISEYGKIEVAVPGEAEQEAIGAVLAGADTEIDLLKQRLTKLRAVKGGMAQQLLTGRTRLPATEAVA